MTVAGRARSSPRSSRLAPSPTPPAAGPGRPTPMRKTGIPLADHMAWGAHLCLFYETREDLLDTNTAYIKAGLDSNEYCIWAISEPITREQAWTALRRDVPDIERCAARGQFEVLSGHEWYLPAGKFDSKRIIDSWFEKLRVARDKGFEGLRISGNAFWLESDQWKEFSGYERELDAALRGQSMLVLCTYALGASSAVDLLDVARAHQFTIARRQGRWEFLETPELKQAKQEIRNLDEALCELAPPFPGQEMLTPRERIVLAQIVRGASSKEAARGLDVSPRTIEFHRANIMPKLGAKNVADLVRIVVGNTERTEQDS